MISLSEKELKQLRREWKEMNFFGNFETLCKWHLAGRPGRFAQFLEWTEDWDCRGAFEQFKEWREKHVEEGSYTEYLKFKNQEEKMKEGETFTSFRKVKELEKENKELTLRLQKYQQLTKNLNRVINEIKSGRLMDRKPWHKERPPTFCQKQGRVSHLSEVPRLKRVAGQVLGIAQLIKDGRNFHCLEILDQLRAAKEAINNVGAHILLRHFQQCLEQDYRGLKYPDEIKKLEKRGYKEEFKFDKFIGGERKWGWSEEEGRMVSRGMARKN